MRMLHSRFICGRPSPPPEGRNGNPAQRERNCRTKSKLADSRNHGYILDIVGYILDVVGINRPGQQVLNLFLLARLRLRVDAVLQSHLLNLAERELAREHLRGLA